MTALPIAIAPIVTTALIVIILALLVACVATDIRSRIIPNRLILPIACLALPYWAAADPHLADRLMDQAAVIAVAAIPLLLLFTIGAWGGGDVKLSAALLLWLPWADAAAAALIMAVAGGVLALLMLPFGRRAIDRGVPYGVAIAVGAALPLAARLPWPGQP